MIMFCHLLSIVDMLDRHVPQVRLALDCNTESFTIASTIQRTRHGCDVSDVPAGRPSILGHWVSGPVQLLGELVSPWPVFQLVKAIGWEKSETV